ncbi:integral membrane protein [Secundilactobacillus pentosiphilus]|uniref:Integral membrane protein n=1 Tax=Secundilactobacillus pentosiphilus TaxID=1714682 RepID=A0A1Z5ILA7_9LACO|nr:acyltransferase [Secundilactobacillus pentosiphilus]GAX02535.1 integral membrane protein [Secundilactobacillus pentosiphilus]
MNDTEPAADIGDYLKLGACTAVMSQPILGYALTTSPSIAAQTWIGILYNLVKYTAPAFIFGILYTTTRMTIDHRDLTYRRYLRNSWHALFIPTIWWTLVYLLVMPQMQQVSRYHDSRTFLWQFVNGNAAPHLWYNTMMLQFIILMPLFWTIGRWCGHDRRRGIFTACVTVLIAAAWLWFYDSQVFHGPHATDWYLLDRLFVSFLIYGIFGVLAWQYHEQFDRLILKWWPVSAVIFAGALLWTNQELFNYGFPVKLTNAPYYKPSMTVYDLAVIGLFAALCLFQVRAKRPFTKFVHRFAGFAYKAYLANVFWSECLWLLFGKALTTAHTLTGILVIYVLTWCLSFSSAFGIHAVWVRVKPVFVKVQNLS